MEISLFVSLFVMFVPDIAKRRRPQWYSVISVITGSEILVKNEALSAGGGSRIAAKRKSPRSRLLNLHD